MKKLLRVLMFLFAATLPMAVLADMPMALMFGFERYVYIPIVLVAEWLVLKFFFELSWGKAAAASITVNAITYAIGFIVAATELFFLFPRPWYESVSTLSYDAIVTLVLLGFALLDTAIELVVLAAGFKCSLSWRRILIWFIANLATTGVLLLGTGLEHATDILSGKRLDAEEVSCIKQKHGAEIEFMRRLGREAPDQLEDSLESYSSGYTQSYYFNKNWVSEREDEYKTIPNFRQVSVYFENGYLNYGHNYDLFADSSMDDLGNHVESEFEIRKWEIVKGEEEVTVYVFELKLWSAKYDRVDAVLNPDPDCLNNHF
jgi:hypothetical protein